MCIGVSFPVGSCWGIRDNLVEEKGYRFFWFSWGGGERCCFDWSRWLYTWEVCRTVLNDDTHYCDLLCFLFGKQKVDEVWKVMGLIAEYTTEARWKESYTKIEEGESQRMNKDSVVIL